MGKDASGGGEKAQYLKFGAIPFDMTLLTHFNVSVQECRTPKAGFSIR